MANFFATYPGSLAGASSLPPGAATAALQIVGNASLASIDGKTVHVDTGSVTIVSSALPTNSAQENGGHLASIDSKLTNPLPVSGTVSVSNFPSTQPVSGTVTANQGAANATPWNDNLSQVGGSNFSLGQQLSASSLPVVLTAAQLSTLTPLSTVAISNFPATQPVSGTVSVSNFPSTQPVSGTVAISNFPATQPVSGTVTADAGTPVPLTITQAALTVGVTAVRLTISGSAPASTRVALVGTPDQSSAAKFYIGSSSVTNSGATRGIQIVAGQSFIANNDAGDYWIVSDTASQTVEVMEQA